MLNNTKNENKQWELFVLSMFNRVNGWASNMLIVEDAGVASKYWMLILYDTIEEGQNKTSHRLFSRLNLSPQLQINLRILCRSCVIQVSF